MGINKANELRNKEDGKGLIELMELALDGFNADFIKGLLYGIPHKGGSFD